ncbi:hypothetical protein Tco_0661476 [Tanacetum coccineum]
MSKKQNCTAMSSAEAEYVALSASCAQVMWMRTQLQDYGFNYNKIPLYCDSQSAIAISCNPVQHSRTKHIHTRYHFIKEQVENGIIELYFVRTEYQLADMFTKALPEDRFKYLVRRIGMRCLTPAELECYGILQDEIPNANLTNVDQTEDEEEDVDERVLTPSDYELTDNENIDDEETMDDEEDDEVTKVLYEDVNVNLGNKDTEMTNADQRASKQQNTKTSLPTLPDFASVFKFNERVFNLEKDVLEIKQVDQYAQALSSIPVIVDRYIDNKLGEAINKAIQPHNFDCIEEAQAKKREYINSLTQRGVKMKNTKIETPLLDQTKGQRRKSSKDAESSRYSRLKEKKSSSTSKDASQSQHKSSGKSAHVEEPSHTVEDSGIQKIKSLSRETMMNNPLTRRLPKLIGSRNLSDL